MTSHISEIFHERFGYERSRIVCNGKFSHDSNLKPAYETQEFAR